MKRALWLLCATLLLPALAACASTTAGREVIPPPDTSPVIARIAGETITMADFESRLDEILGVEIAGMLSQGQTREQIEQLAADAQIRTRIFDQMVQDVLLADYARRNGIGVDPAAIDRAVPPTPAPAPTEPSDPTPTPGPSPTPGPPATVLREQAAQQQVVLEVVARNTRAEMAHIRHILVADEAAADQVLADLAAGADFARLARERSADTASAEEGGDLGWTPRGDYEAAFEEAAFSIAPNTPTKVQSEFGWHVIEVLAREESRPFDSFERLQQSRNGQTFLEETFEPWYEELRSQAEQAGELQLAEGFDPNTVPLPFPASAP